MIVWAVVFAGIYGALARERQVAIRMAVPRALHRVAQADVDAIVALGVSADEAAAMLYAFAIRFVMADFE